MKSPFLALGFLIISLTILALIGYSIHQKDLRVAAEAALVEAGVELEGAKKAILVAPKEIIKFVEVPAAVASAVKKGAMTPIAAGKINATSDTIEIPCPEPPPDSTIIYSDSPLPKPKYTTTPLTFGLTGEVFLGAIKHGAIEHTIALKGTVWNDDGWNSDIAFKPENVAFDVVFSKEVKEAIEEHSRPFFQRHFRFTFPAVTLGYNVFDPSRPVVASVGASWGYVW